MRKVPAVIIGSVVGVITAVIVIFVGLFFKVKTVVFAGGLAGGMGVFVATKLMQSKKIK